MIQVNTFLHSVIFVYKLHKSPAVYILRLRDKTFYCGISQYVTRRYVQHQQGGCISTRRKLPVTLEFLKYYLTMKEARQMEVRIKAYGVGRWYKRNVLYR